MLYVLIYISGLGLLDHTENNVYFLKTENLAALASINKKV